MVVRVVRVISGRCAIRMAFWRAGRLAVRHGGAWRAGLRMVGFCFAVILLGKVAASVGRWRGAVRVAQWWSGWMIVKLRDVLGRQGAVDVEVVEVHGRVRIRRGVLLEKVRECRYAGLVASGPVLTVDLGGW